MSESAKRWSPCGERGQFPFSKGAAAAGLGGRGGDEFGETSKSLAARGAPVPVPRFD